MQNEIKDDQKMSINIEKLHNQVKSEILADEKYWRENSAKMRAIEQKVATYEDFRQIVLASHLRPLDKGESLRDNKNKETSTNKVWNSLATNSNSSSSHSNSTLTNNSSDLAIRRNNLINTVPRNGLEFAKLWRQCEENFDDEETRWQFLVNIGLKRLQELLDHQGDLLGKFLCLFSNKVLKSEAEANEDDVKFIVELLRIFSRSKRFVLNYSFLSKNEHEACQMVFKYLEDNGIKDIDDFKKSYSK